jgi:hypothetical protein
MKSPNQISLEHADVDGQGHEIDIKKLLIINKSNWFILFFGFLAFIFGSKSQEAIPAQSVVPSAKQISLEPSEPS